MRSWKVTELGEPGDVLAVKEVPQPEVEKGKLLIEVEASSLNFFDILLCQGKYQEKPPVPFTPGAEICGVVRKAGEDTTMTEGQRVIATPDLPEGGLCERVAVSESNVFAIPDQMPASEAA